MKKVFYSLCRFFLCLVLRLMLAWNQLKWFVEDAVETEETENPIAPAWRLDKLEERY